MKSQFTSPLLVEQMSDSDWRLFQDFTYESEKLDRVILVPAGFVTDFASVPRVPVAYWLTGGTSVKPAVIHDYLYRSCTASKSDADDVFMEAMKVTGQPAWRRALMWSAVHTFGGGAYCTGKNPASSALGNRKALGITDAAPIVPARAAKRRGGRGVELL